LLKVAATATAEVWARLFDPIRRGDQDLFDRSKQNISLLPLDANAQTISGYSQRNKNRVPCRVGQSVTTRQNAFDLNFQRRHLLA